MFFSTNDLAQLIELRFYIPLNTESIISETFSPANLLAWYWRN